MNPKTNKIAMVAQKVLIVAAAMVLIDGCELYTDLYTCITLHFFGNGEKIIVARSAKADAYGYTSQ